MSFSEVRNTLFPTLQKPLVMNRLSLKTARALKNTVGRLAKDTKFTRRVITQRESTMLNTGLV